jgi:excisionase family DNA binding protein
MQMLIFNVPENAGKEVHSAIQALIRLATPVEASSPAPAAPREWLSIEQAAEYCGASRTTIYRWRKNGLIKSSPAVTGRPRFERAALDRFLKGIKR